jgi:hypothetical protein
MPDYDEMMKETFETFKRCLSVGAFIAMTVLIIWAVVKIRRFLGGSSFFGGHRHGGPKVHLHAIIHSDIGRFGFFRHDRRLHFISGGHGEKNLHLLKLFRFHLPRIHKTTNGVRLAEIGSTRKPDPKEKKRLHTWFPSSWKGADIKKAGEAISKGKEIKATGLERLKGEYDGVKIKMIVRDGDIKSVFPDSNQKGAGKNGKHAG